MARFIELGITTGGKGLLNIDAIIAIYPHRDGKRTEISMIDGGEWVADESYAEVKAMLIGGMR